MQGSPMIASGTTEQFKDGAGKRCLDPAEEMMSRNQNFSPPIVVNST